MFRDGRGPLYEFLKEIGRDMSDCGKHTPFGRFLNRAIEGNHPYLLVHMNELSNGDLNALKRSAGKDSIVHCPRSHQYFGHSPFQFEKLKQLGFNICLGTDSLASNDNLNLFAEIFAGRYQFEMPGLPMREEHAEVNRG